MSAIANLRPGGLTLRFGDTADRIKVMDVAAWNEMRAHTMKDARYQLNQNEVTAIEKEIQHVLRDVVVSPLFINAKNIGPALSWKFNQWNNVLAPRLSRDPGRRGDVVSTNKTETSVDLYAWDYDYYISMLQMDIAKNSATVENFSESLRQGTLTELTNSLAEYREWFIHRGSDIPNVTDIGITGVFNNASVTDPGALGKGSDDNLTAAGDVFYSATLMATKLILAKFKPPFVLLMTPGVMSQSLINLNATTDKSDYQYITEMMWVNRGTKTPMFETIESDPFLIDDTETTSTGAMGVLKKGDSNMRVVEAYPFGFRPLPSQDLGVEGKLFWMGAVELRRPTAVVYADALTINTV